VVLATPTFQKFFSAVTFGAVNLTGSRDTGHAYFSKTFFRAHVGTTLGPCLSNLKLLAFAILDILAFNAKHLTDNERVLSFQVPVVCAKFCQNW